MAIGPLPVCEGGGQDMTGKLEPKEWEAKWQDVKSLTVSTIIVKFYFRQLHCILILKNDYIFLFSEFSFTNWMLQKGKRVDQTLTPELTSTLLSDLGIKKYLMNASCDPPQHHPILTVGKWSSCEFPDCW